MEPDARRVFFLRRPVWGSWAFSKFIESLCIPSESILIKNRPHPLNWPPSDSPYGAATAMATFRPRSTRREALGTSRAPSRPKGACPTPAPPPSQNCPPPRVPPARRAAAGCTTSSPCPETWPPWSPPMAASEVFRRLPPPPRPLPTSAWYVL